MTYWLTEDSFIPMLTGIFAAVTLLLMAWSARNKTVMGVGLLVAVVTAGIVTTEMMIVTDRETVTDLVYELAGHVRKNDVDAIVGHLSPQVPEIENRMRGQMGQYRVEGCSIVGVNDFSSDGENAQIDFVAWGQGSKRRGGLAGAANPRVILKLKKQQDGSWKIVGYSVSDPRSGISL